MDNNSIEWLTGEILAVAANGEWVSGYLKTKDELTQPFVSTAAALEMLPAYATRDQLICYCHPSKTALIAKGKGAEYWLLDDAGRTRVAMVRALDYAGGPAYLLNIEGRAALFTASAPIEFLRRLPFPLKPPPDDEWENKHPLNVEYVHSAQCAGFDDIRLSTVNAQGTVWAGVCSRGSQAYWCVLSDHTGLTVTNTAVADNATLCHVNTDGTALLYYWRVDNDQAAFGAETHTAIWHIATDTIETIMIGNNTPTCITDDAAIAIGYSNDDVCSAAGVWRRGEGWRTLPLPQGGRAADAQAISQDGAVIGLNVTAPTMYSQPAVYRDGKSAWVAPNCQDRFSNWESAKPSKIEFDRHIEVTPRIARKFLWNVLAAKISDWFRR